MGGWSILEHRAYVCHVGFGQQDAHHYSCTLRLDLRETRYDLSIRWGTYQYFSHPTPATLTEWVELLQKLVNTCLDPTSPPCGTSSS